MATIDGCGGPTVDPQVPERSGCPDTAGGGNELGDGKCASPVANQQGDFHLYKTHQALLRLSL